MQQTTNDLKAAVRQMQILAGALLAGVVVFFGVVIAVAGPPAAARELPIVSIVLAAMPAMEAPAFFILPGLIDSGTARGSGEQNTPTGRYQAAMVIRMALCEGAAFANLLAYFIEQQWWSLAIVGFLVLVMLSMFPTKTKLEHWLEIQQMEAEEVP